MDKVVVFKKPYRLGAGCRISTNLVSGYANPAHAESKRKAHFVFATRAEGCNVGLNKKGRTLVEETLSEQNQRFVPGSTMRAMVKWLKPSKTEFVLIYFDKQPARAAWFAQQLIMSVNQALKSHGNDDLVRDHFTIKL